SSSRKSSRTASPQWSVTFGSAATGASASSSPRSISTVCRWATRGARRSLSTPSPAPTSSTTSLSPTPESRTIASSRFGSARKLWPSLTTARLPAEERGGVGLDRALEVRQRDAALGRDHLGGGDDVGGLVALAAAHLRGEEGRVGLDQDAVLGDLGGGEA